MLRMKSTKVRKLALQLARETDETVTRAVIEARRLRLAQVRRQRQSEGIAQDLLAIGRRCCAGVNAAPIATGDELYDGLGLPR